MAGREDKGTGRQGEWERGSGLRGAMMLAVVLVAAAMPAVASAQTLLRWKLKEGEGLGVEVKQQTDSVVAFGGKSAATKIELALGLAWKVVRTSDDDFVIRQTVERMKQTLTTRDAGTVEFDSAEPGRPTGQAKDLADALKPLVGAEFDLTMNARGEILKAEPVNEAAKAVFAGTAGSSGQAAGRNSLEQMLRRPLVVLPPGQVSVGNKWSASSERETAAGQLKLDTAYELTRVDGPLAEITVAAKVTPSGDGQTKVKKHQHVGTVRFSVADGRVVDSEQKQNLVTERPYRETTITVTLNSTQTTTVK